VTEAIEALPPKGRQAITLYYREDLAPEGIAEVMNLSISRISRLFEQGDIRSGEALRGRWAEMIRRIRSWTALVRLGTPTQPP